MQKKIQPTFKSYYYDYDLLSSKAKKFLKNGFQLGENDKRLFFGKSVILDDYYADEQEKNFSDVPQEWWENLDLNPILRKQIEEIFKENEENVVIFCYPGDELD
jgi:hypothetical protein